MKTVNIGLIGLGAVGKAVAEGIISNGKLIADRTGVSLVLKGICDKDKNALNSINAKDASIKTGNADELISSGDIDIIVELIGGIDPAKKIVLSAIKNKKHVVTANKALLSECWKEIFGAASENNVFVKFEASVGGSIPIIRTLQESFVSNNFNVVYGILNGTTNFILTKMDKDKCGFSDALSVAQEKGIAEADPELDISGKDSAHKLAILSLLGFGIEVSPDDIYTEGITKIGPQDIEYAARWGYSIKLLAIAKRADGELQLRVHPTLIASSHLLSDVKGSDNAIFVDGDFVGESLLYGKGAGGRPTSSSVIGDIVDAAKQIAFSDGKNNMGYNLAYAGNSLDISRMEELKTSYYLRFSAVDKPGVLAGISKILADNDISIANVSQEEHSVGEVVPVIILTHKAEEGNMRKAIESVDKLEYIKDKTVVIRIEEEEWA